MFKGFQNTGKAGQFKGIPSLDFQMNNEAYGFSGCVFWLTASEGLNTQTNLTNISRWVSKVGGYSFEQSTAGNQPRLIVSDADFNNHPSVDFSESISRFITSIRTINLNPPQGLTIAVVYKKIADSTGTININPLINNDVNFTIAGNAFIQLRAANISPTYGFGIATGLPTVAPPLDSGINDTAAHIAIITGGTSNAEIVVNGVSKVTGTWTVFGAGWNRIGHSGSTVSLLAKVPEIIIYNQKLSSTDMIRLSSNINSKYAIY